ncbi:MAG: N-acetylmuramoyl-L-alanine amidase [Hyphomonadaceae bacterium]|nr:N-acetylmuramoyl-L-alanine amidase [Clostridia bacterium]
MRGFKKWHKIKMLMALIGLSIWLISQIGCATSAKTATPTPLVAITTNAPATPTALPSANPTPTIITAESPKPIIKPVSTSKPVAKPAEKMTAVQPKATERATLSEHKQNAGVLNGKTICIDPGHGNPNHATVQERIAPDSHVMKPATAYGTTGISTKIPEYKLTMVVSLKLKSALLKAGAKVIMTRDSNATDVTNIERAEIANHASADLAVRIHADGIGNTAVTGISTLTPGSQSMKDATLRSNSAKAASLVLDSVIKTTHAKSRGVVERNDLTGFNWSKVPVILLEMGFMTNADEDQLLNTDAYQNKIVDGIVDGLIKYFQ